MEAATKQIEERKKQLSFTSSVPAAPVIKLHFSQKLKDLTYWKKQKHAYFRLCIQYNTFSYFSLTSVCPFPHHSHKWRTFQSHGFLAVLLELQVVRHLLPPPRLLASWMMLSRRPARLLNYRPASNPSYLWNLVSLEPWGTLGLKT